MNEPIRTALSQRPDYTYKLNAKEGRFGWLRLTPAFSLKIVNEVLDVYDEVSDIRVLDPFCGTGTTALCASYHGQNATTTDINPFLIWLSQVKTDYYSPSLIHELREQGRKMVVEATQANAKLAPLPRLHNIDRWWNPDALDFLRKLKWTIDSNFNKKTKRHSLLTVAFCRTLINLSNAAFNHQSMSFKSSAQSSLRFDFDIADVYINDMEFVLDGAARNPSGKVQVLNVDSRSLCADQVGDVDCVITSPPYANRMSYIRELRPYMYWLGFLQNGRDAGEMDWEAIGGTWGVATSRLNDWSVPKSGFKSKLLDVLTSRMDVSENKNGKLLSTYVLKYFDDMWRHFRSLAEVLTNGAHIHYIVGNSTFYGVLVPTQRIYAEMLAELGFNGVECVPLRKRNSKKELIEFDVRAHWR